MKRGYLAAFVLAFAAICHGDSFLQCRSAVDGSLSPGYTEYAAGGAGWTNTGTGGACTAVPAPPEGWSTYGSRRKSSDAIDGWCQFELSGFAAGMYDVYFAYAYTTRTDAANSTFAVWDNLTSETAPLASGGVAINATNGNTWLKLTTTPVSIDTTATVRISQGSPQGDYMTVSGVRIAPAAGVRDWPRH